MVVSYPLWYAVLSLTRTKATAFLLCIPQGNGTKSVKGLNMSSTLKRGVFHIIIILSIAVAILLLPRIALLVSLATVTYLFLAFEFLRLRVSAVNDWFFLYFRPLLREEEMSCLTGASYALIASLIAFLAFPKEIALLAICFLAMGDAVATIVGKYWGKRRVLGRTLEGNIACLISCIVIGLVFHYVGPGIRLVTIMVGSISAAFIESIPLPVNDNLTMPLFSGLVMTLME